MNNFEYLIGQVGSRSARRISAAMLLETSDLPGPGWKILDQRIWRTGLGGKRTDIGRRAYRAGTFTAARSFEQSNSRWCWIQIVPYASAADAVAIIPELRSRFVANPRAKVTVTEERQVHGVNIPDLMNPWVYEQETLGKHGPSLARYVAGNVDHVMFLVSCSEFGTGWPWDEVAIVASAQNLRIRSALESPSRP